MNTFIEKHLRRKIEELIKEKQAILKHDSFYWFNEPIVYNKKLINRVNRFNPYLKEEILPISWYSCNGRVLKEIFFKLKNNEFYILKTSNNGRNYKTRIKNDNRNKL